MIAMCAKKEILSFAGREGKVRENEESGWCPVRLFLRVEDGL
jgi:hypothetical protein